MSAERTAANAAVARGVFDAFARRDGVALRKLFHPDATWTVPGQGVMAGVYRGCEEIFGFLGRLPGETDGTYRSELVDVLASDTHAAALYRARGERAGRTLDLDQVLLFRIDDGAIVAVTALPTDPIAFERFWG